MKNNSRRSFIKYTSALSSGLLIIPSLYGYSANNRLNVAVIGVGGRGQANWSRVPQENIVAMCDVDDNRAKDGYKLHPKVRKFKDFRVMFDKMHKEIDAVIISTPDHTHFAATMAAMELGKHVYVEKPLAHNVWELRTLKKAAKYYGIVSQMGNQGHTTNGIRLIKEWYEAGILGQVKEVHAWIGSFNFRPGHYWTRPESFPPPKHPVPDYLDWDLWLGPAKFRDFNSAYAPKSWRGFYDFGNGQLGDWSCHTLDGPFWSLDLGMPKSINVDVTNPMTKQNFVSEKSIVTYSFEKNKKRPPVTLKWYEGGLKPELYKEMGIDKMKSFDRQGMVMVGDKNSLITGGRPNNPRLVMSDSDWDDFKRNAPEKTIPRIKDETPVEEWVHAIKNDTLPLSNFEYGASLTEMAVLGCLAQRFNANLDYDSKNMKIINRPDVDRFIKPTVRKGWSYGDNF
ncbi:Gfo/Idh/MocA family oxidoreductase [Flavobacteriaceae bacterium]|nr:Gfo/Idh/MocA family oxidoreductase [Flavobacteriaceae bacterium]